MSEINLTECKRRISEGAKSRGLPWGDSKISRAATKIHKRLERWEDLDLEVVFGHSDPTPKKAIRNLEKVNHWRVAL